jgi:gliding motility-associated protein GldM
MAGGKETPRQKMIGMMYLVLTALLAMNVSKTILNGYVRVNESIVRSRENLERNNETVTKAFENSLSGNAGSIPYFERAKEAQKLLKETTKYIDEVRNNVLTISEKLPPGGGDTLQLKNVMMKENYDDPARVMGVAEPSAPVGGPLTALELKEKLTKLSSDLMKILEDMNKDPKTKLDVGDYENLKHKIEDLLPRESGAIEDGIKMTWETENFYHMPIVAVVCNLNKTVADLASTEAEILSVLSGASGKISIKFDNLKARVIAPSSYIQAGQQYTADIFIAASSSKISKEDMKIYLGIDSAAAAEGKTGEEVPIVGGEGKLLRGTSGQGEQKYFGVIKYKNPDGSFKYYPFKSEYMVAAPSVAISADQMRVFYAGVENPVSVSAAGVSPTDIQISATGGGAKYVSTGAGKYNFTFTGTGTCNITVSAKGKVQGQPIAFKVKALPKPEIKVGGVFSPPEMKRAAMALVGGVGAGANGFEFQANFIVQHLDIIGKVKGKLMQEECNGANLTPQAAAIFKNADPNTKVYVEARIKGPDGKITEIAHGIKVAK